MKFETLKTFTVMQGKVEKTIPEGKVFDSRDLGITDKSMAELARGKFLHIEKGHEPAPKAQASKEGK